MNKLYQYFCWDTTDVAPLVYIIEIAREHPTWELYMPTNHNLEAIMVEPENLNKAILDKYSQEIEWAEEDPDDDYEPPTYKLCEW
ncbi:MAG: hypothetical protein ACTSU6_04375 [Candidatus Njordarchaeales archaeon]